MQLTPIQIQISDRAMAELIRLGVGGPQFLRLRVIPGGCAGMTYSAAMDSSLEEGDEVVTQQDDVRVIADSGSTMFLDGLQIDFSDDLIQAGFRFKNPNASHSCGCGSSFGA